ncbi:MAG: hypothetical protein ACI4WG_05445 [Erysipelotrichaceae bacterium]
MKKICICLSLLLLLAGCQSKTLQPDQEKYNSYLSYYQSILDNDIEMSSSQCYDITLIVNKLDEQEYRYDVIIDNPRVAMYDIKALAVVNDLTIAIDQENMMPCIGILDDNHYNMIPNQVDNEKNFVSGLDLSLVSSSSSLKISVMIEWKDSSEINYVREYISLYAVYEETTQE